VVGSPVGEIGNFQGGQRVIDALIQLRSGQSEISRPELDVLTYGWHEQLVVRVLKDEANPATDFEEIRCSDGEP